MTKLKYPTGGIYNIVKTDLDDCVNNLNNASSNTDYKTPTGFAYKNYMSNIKQTIRGFAKEINSISNSIKKTDKTFEELEVDMEEKAKVINGYQVNERNRIIY